MVRARNESSINGALLQGRGALCPIPTPHQPRPSATRGFGFLGEIHPYPNGQHVAGGRGLFYVSNPRRSLRKLTPGEICPFCKWRDGVGFPPPPRPPGGDARGAHVGAPQQKPHAGGGRREGP